eukprot:scaffold103924_cov69-Phaeocystis_antarctica.AAC.3
MAAPAGGEGSSRGSEEGRPRRPQAPRGGEGQGRAAASSLHPPLLERGTVRPRLSTRCIPELGSPRPASPHARASPPSSCDALRAGGRPRHPQAPRGAGGGRECRRRGERRPAGRPQPPPPLALSPCRPPPLLPRPPRHRSPRLAPPPRLRRTATRPSCGRLTTASSTASSTSSPRAPT